MLAEINPDDVRVEKRERQDFGDMDSLVASVKEHGILTPITVDSSMKLLAGERRLKAAKMLMLETIPALVRPAGEILTDLEIELAENIHRKDFTWQERVRLEKRLYDLKQSVRGAADIAGVSKSHLQRHLSLAEAMEHIPELATYSNEVDAWKRLNRIQEGMVIEELKKRAVSAAETAELDDEIPTARAPGEKISIEQYTVRAHNNYKVGNFLDEVKGLLEAKVTKFDFAEVDPPYGIDLSKQRMTNTEVMQDVIEGYAEIPASEYADFLKEATQRVYEILAANAFCIWWFGPTHFATTLRCLTDAGFQISPIPAIWYKGDQGQTQAPNVNLANCYEMFWVCRKGSPVIAKPGRSNVFQFTGVSGQSKSHHTERPVELIKEILETFTVPLHRVIVPFLGSGNTLRAAYMHRNPVLGWDIDASYKAAFILNVQKDYENGKYPT